MYNIIMKTETFKINHRYLVKIWPSYKYINEVEVLEITKAHIKLKIYCEDRSNYIQWKELRDIEIIEDLGIVTSMFDNNLPKTY